MFKIIVRKELREIIGSTKFAATFGVCAILIILAFFVGIKNYQAGMQEYESSKVAQLQKFESVTDWNMVFSQQVFLQPKPLAYLITGISNDIGRTANIDGRSRPSLIDSVYSDHPVFAVFRYLDLEFVFQIILSLFAILFAFDAINGERERGTLRLSFANPIPRTNYLLGKLFGSYMALTLPLLIPILIGLLLLVIMGISLSIDEWIRLGLFILCGMLYLGVFLTMSVFMSCLTKRSSSSFLLLLVIWVCSVLIVPRASVLIAGNMVEVPTSAEIYFKMVQLEKQNSKYMSKKLDEYDEKSYQERIQNGDNSPETMEKRKRELDDLYEKLSEENNKKAQKLESRLNEERRNKQIKRERQAFGISRISPAAVFTMAATTLGMTSTELKNHFQEEAAAYSVSFAEFIQEKTGHPIGGKRVVIDLDQKGKKKQLQPINPREIPEFVYQSPELSHVLYGALPDISLLLLYNLIFFSGAFLAFLRFDVR